MTTEITYPLTRINQVDTISDVRQFLKELTSVFGLGFHPDDLFELELIDEQSDKIESERLNKLMDKAFEICEREGVEIYGLGMEALEEPRQFHMDRLEYMASN